MTAPSKLLQINNLTRKEGVWVLDQPTQFNYSDGEGSELFLKRVVSKARDLSSQSLELETCFSQWDWVSEYHLSFKRANLLRSLDLAGVENALEIGCGCGAITRFLGEQGISVDAIEGAQRRADIARLRCRDLDTVRIINANYNDLMLPTAEYDAVFVVGVIEYAQRFLPGADNDEMAVVTILKQLQSALKPDGVLIIAIENKNGLKYWLGATEDHFGKPYAGLTNYWGLSGTRTYAYEEWPGLLKKAGIAHWHFQFPFPDYKLPQVILDEDFVDGDENTYSLLYRISSRDYLRPWQSGANEFALWRALHQSGQLKKYANSFLITAGQNDERIGHLLPADFAYFSGGSRKPEFRTVTIKERQADQVIKKYLWANEENSRKELTRQVSHNPYIRGTLLSTIWLEALLALDGDLFEQLLGQYFRFIQQQLAKETKSSLIDALPANVVVEANSSYHVIDQEWQASDPVSAEFLLFRALLWFGHDNQDLLADFYRFNRLTCLHEFIEFGFNALTTTSSATMADFAVKEDTIQFQVSGQNNLQPIQLLLSTPFNFQHIHTSCLKLFWTGDDKCFDDPRSCEVSYNFESGRGVTRCRFEYNQKITHVRIMPLFHASEAKIFVLKKFALKQFEMDDVEARLIWSAALNQNIAADVDYNHFVLPLSNPEGGFIANDRKAVLDFHINDTPEVDDSSSGLYELELVLANEAALGPSLVTDQIARHSGSIENEIDVSSRINSELNEQLNEANQLITETADTVRGREDEIRQLKAQLLDANKRIKLSQTKQSAILSELKAVRRFVDRLSQVKFIRGAGRVWSGKYGWITSGLNQHGRFRFNQDDYDLVKNSDLFDEDYYMEYQPDLEPFQGDPLRHYLLFGGFNGLNPNRLFDTPFYLRQCSELATEMINPLVHYLQAGAGSARNPCYLFDVSYYLQRYPEVSEESDNPLGHYLNKGGDQELDPHAVFDTKYYLSQCPDAKNSPLTPLEHYFAYGELNQISPTALFDWNYYLKNRPGLIGADISAFRHFIEYGFREGRNFSQVFDSRHYFYPDRVEKEYKVNTVEHYIEKGQYEGRSPNPFFDPDYYTGQLTPEDQKRFKDLFSVYIVKGEKSGGNPHPLLCTLFYKNQLQKIGTFPHSLLHHFYINGFNNSCMTHPLLEPGFSMAQLPYDQNGEFDELLRYFTEDDFGAAMNPHPLFDTLFYRSHFDHADKVPTNPLIHYVKEGCQQGLSTHPDFNPQFYCSQDLDPAFIEGQSPVEHYVYHGAQRTFWPCQEIAQLAYKPQISLIYLIHGPDFTCLSGRIVSLMAQLYPLWQATVTIRNPDNSDDFRYAKALAEEDKRIQWIETDDSESAATLFNQALEKSRDEFVVFLSEHNYLQAHAILAIIRQLNANKDLTLIHTDRNANDPDCVAIEQPGLDSSGLINRFFIGPLACFRRSVIDEMGGFATWHQSPYDAKFLTHYLHQSPINSVAHISEPLHFTMAQNPLHIVVRNPMSSI